MKIFSWIGLVLRQLGTSFRHLFWTHVLTVMTMAIALFVFGAFMLLQTNLEHLVRGWSDELQVSAYLKNGLAEDQVRTLMKRIEAMPEVARARHISHAQARRDFETALGSQSGLLDGLPAEALPASIEITLRASERSEGSIGQLAARLKEDRDITSVEYPQQWVEKLDLAALVVSWAKWVFGGILFLATFFIVRSTVKLALFTRKDEVEILQLVGASEELIQAPFVIEGMIQGLTGAALAICGLWGFYLLLQDQMVIFDGLLAPIGRLQFLPPGRVALLVAIGWLLGSAGSLFSLRRFIRTWHASSGEF